jgi:hypothetical protein
MKTVADLAALVRQKTWDKDLVLWVGPIATLSGAIGQTRHVDLDLLDLFDEECLPMDDEETRAQLIQGLRNRLKSIQPGPSARTVLVVRSIGLLARYHAGVQLFYDWFCGDFAMVVLALEPLSDGTAWPEDVNCDENRLLKYFTEPGVVKEAFGEGTSA